MKPTSAEAYRQITEEGLLKKLKMSVYKAVHKMERATANEVYEEVRRMGVTQNKPSITPRLAQLVKMGVIRECGERPCTVSGRTCVVYQITDQLPRQLTRAERKACLKDENAALRKEVDVLRDRVRFLEKELSRWGRPSKKKLLEGINHPTLFPDASMDR